MKQTRGKMHPLFPTILPLAIFLSSVPALGQSVNRVLPDSYCIPTAITVTINVAGTAGAVAAYTVDDVLPTGWTASGISNGGQWVAATRRVRWFFLDDQPRTLTYTATPGGEVSGSQTWGTGSEFGYTPIGSSTPVISSIGGDTILNQVCEQTPTSTPTVTLTQGPSPTKTPTGSSTATKTHTWTPTVTPVKPTVTPTATFPTGVSAARDLTESYCPGTAISVSIGITGTTGVVAAYTVDDVLPVGWTASSISDSGQWTPASRRIRWFFLDDQPRTLSYLATPSGSVSGNQTWGTGSEFGYTPIGSTNPVIVSIDGDKSVTQNCAAVPTSTPTLSRTPTHTKTNTPTPTFTPIDSNGVRDLPTHYVPGVVFDISIAVTPDANTEVWSLEDNPPSGWIVSNINNAGIWDDVNKKVKWGLFFDAVPRILSYQVLSPATETIAATFSGLYSWNSFSEAVGGDKVVHPLLLHPADTNRDWNIDINQMTAYAAAWKRGSTWPTDPNPIPIEFVTNVGLIWKTGEVYHYDSSKIPPLCWISGSGNPTIWKKAELVTKTAHAEKSTSTIIRSLSPEYYTPGKAVLVTVSVTPDPLVVAWALEESPPDGWIIAEISDGGAWETVNEKVKWGPFFDSVARVFTYQAIPPAGESGPKNFSGQASFDGSGGAVQGERSISDGPSLIWDWNQY